MKPSCLLYTGALLAPASAFHSLPRFSLSQEYAVKNTRHDSPDSEGREVEQEHGKRQGGGGTLTGALGALVGTVGGLAGSVAAAVDLDNKRPEPGYPYQAPGPNDSRGPCPGLNLLANHGYLPRGGHVTFGQVLDATARGFNMGADLATLLGVFAVLTDGNITDESFYLGAPPSGVGGLNRHSTVEADISPNREDFYNGCGDNHHLSSRRFKQNVGLVAASTSKQFDIGVMRQQYAANAKFSQQNNPYLYFAGFPAVVTLGAYPFYPNFMSNGTYGLGGVANYDSISSIIGAQFNSKTGDFTYVPEKWPSNWYRRSVPYGVVELRLELEILSTYAADPVPEGVPQLGTSNLNASTVLCDVYQTIRSASPLALAGSAEAGAAAIAWALSKLAPFFLAPSVLGCPAGALSPTDNAASDALYPDASSAGGPRNYPPGVFKNVGNNVYGQTYFTTAPSNPPQCT